MNRIETNKAKNCIHFVFDREASIVSPVSSPEGNDSTFDKLIDQEPLNQCMLSFEKLIGLESVRDFIKEIFAWLEIGRRRQAIGLLSEQQVLHMVFSGNPGTGKTTVARIIARLLHDMGVLSKGHLVEVERADLVGEYIGHTAQKTREHVKRALGGILFIDEAYSLARGGEKDFGKEAIDTLVKSMEDYKNDFILILAGYVVEMEHFLRSNPGLPSRFPIHLKFPDFTIEQLLEIADNMVAERQYNLSITAKEKLRRQIVKEIQKKREFGNARYIRNMIEQAIRQHAVRLLSQKYSNRDELMTLRGEDFKLEGVTKKMVMCTI